MRIPLFIFVIIWFQFEGKTQSAEFPTEHGLWGYTTLLDASAGYTQFEKIAFTEDSVYNGKVYKKLITVVSGPQANRGLIRSEEKKVYFVPNNDTLEYVLYDFTLEVGDKFLPPQFAPHTTNDSLIVTEIDTIDWWGSVERKHWRFESTGFFWIEGIGAEIGFLDDPWYEFDINGYNYLECFTADSVNVYQNTCGSSIANNDFEKISLDVSVFPNPFSKIINVETTPTKPIELLQLYNLNGQLIHSEKGQSVMELNSNIPSGIYFLKIGIDGNFYFRYVIKQR